MKKPHLKITLISILITSTLFNSANENIADANEDTDENYQEENDINDRTEDAASGEEWTAEDLNEGGSAPEEDNPVDDGAAEAPQAVEDEELLTPADHVEGEAPETVQEETLPAEPEVDVSEEPVVEEPAAETPESEEPAAEETIDEENVPEEAVTEEPVIEEPAAENNESDEEIEAEVSGGPDGEEQYNSEEPIDGGNVESGIDEEAAYESSGDRTESVQPEQHQPAEEGSFTNEQPSYPVEAEQNESLETYEYHHEEPAAGQPADAGSRDTHEYGGTEAEGTVDEARPGTAGKKLHRYDYGDILSGISFSPGESDESLALLDKRVNRIMTSKIIEEDEVSKEDIMELEEEIKNESGITSSDREVLPNTGEASNYNYLYSIMLIAAGTTLFFITKRPRQQ